MSRYAPSSYDDYLCLRPPLLLWVAVLYWSRAFTLPVVLGLGSFVHINSDAIRMLQGLWSVQTLFPSVIAVLVLYAMFRRVPTASQAVRWIWSHGRLLLSTAAVIDLALLALSVLRLGELDDQALPSLVAALIDVYFVLYILTARRVRDTFAAFPGVPGPAESGAKLKA